jgi:transcription antitermination factor NusG
MNQTNQIDQTNQVNQIDQTNQMNQTNQTNQTNNSHWYALRTKSRHEKVVRDQLDRQGIEQLLPTVRRLSQWKDRKKEIDVPLFSGYCFVRFGKGTKPSVQKVAGVVEIVGSGGRPEPIPDGEIENLKTLMSSVLPYDPHPYLHEGMVVEVVRGPLRGVRGVLLRKEKRHRLVVGIRLIQQAAAVEIDVRDVEPVSSSFETRSEHGGPLT